MTSEYTPAAGVRAFTPLYDLAVRAGLREKRMRDCVLDDAALQSGMRILDLACGTGTLAVLAKQRVPDAEVIGVDIDHDVLAIARRKAANAKVAVRFAEQAISDSLLGFAPLDRVFSSLVMHHLSARARVEALTRAREALAPGGGMHVVDFGRPSSRRMRAAFLSIQLLDGFATTRDALQSTVADHLLDAGFVDVRERRHLDTAFGTLRFWSARR